MENEGKIAESISEASTGPGSDSSGPTLNASECLEVTASQRARPWTSSAWRRILKRIKRARERERVGCRTLLSLWN